jgi:hypothetical protein
MSDFERRLREAMSAAAEPPPGGLMAAIRRRHRRHVWRLGTACVAAVAAVGIAVPLITNAMAGPAGHRPAGIGPVAPATSPAVVMPTATPTAVPTAAPGTVLRDCQNNNNGTLSSGWKAQSIHAGPVWFIFARGSHSWPQSRRLAGGRMTYSAFVIAIANGRRAIVTDAPAAGSRFRFLASMSGSTVEGGLPPPGSSHDLGPAVPHVGAPGLTLIGCPVYPVGTGIPESYAPGLTMFWQGFVNEAGGCVPLEVRTAPGRQPIRVDLGATTNGKCGS